MNKPCCHTEVKEKPSFHWKDASVWLAAAKNTLWCLLGCTIGDLGTIFAFQHFSPSTPTLTVMVLAIINGILTSIVLETCLLKARLGWNSAFKTAVGMSFISMISMEAAMNLTDYFLTGGARVYWWTIAPMLIAGFLAPLPYNYWRLKHHGKACH